MGIDGGNFSGRVVALLAEGVDRNCFSSGFFRHCLRSPSSRRAWIEMLAASRYDAKNLVALLAEGVDRNQLIQPMHKHVVLVALLAEGVDRNLKETVNLNDLRCRPPRGGRG